MAHRDDVEERIQHYREAIEEQKGTDRLRYNKNQGPLSPDEEKRLRKVEDDIFYDLQELRKKWENLPAEEMQKEYDRLMADARGGNEGAPSQPAPPAPANPNMPPSPQDGLPSKSEPSTGTGKAAEGLNEEERKKTVAALRDIGEDPSRWTFKKQKNNDGKEEIVAIQGDEKSAHQRCYMSEHHGRMYVSARTEVAVDKNGHKFEMGTQTIPNWILDELQGKSNGGGTAVAGDRQTAAANDPGINQTPKQADVGQGTGMNAGANGVPPSGKPTVGSGAREQGQGASR